jgi:hypothetical protein
LKQPHGNLQGLIFNKGKSMIQLDRTSGEAQCLEEQKTRLPVLDHKISPADLKQFPASGVNLKKRFPRSNAAAWLRLRTARAMRLLPLLLLYGSLTSVVATLAANLNTIDGTFNVEANNSVGCLAMQPDGKLVVGGHLRSWEDNHRIVVNMQVLCTCHLLRIPASAKADTNRQRSASSWKMGSHRLPRRLIWWIGSW